jgi:hypothetical protein
LLCNFAPRRRCGGSRTVAACADLPCGRRFDCPGTGCLLPSARDPETGRRHRDRRPTATRPTRAWLRPCRPGHSGSPTIELDPGAVARCRA